MVVCVWAGLVRKRERDGLLCLLPEGLESVANYELMKKERIELSFLWLEKDTAISTNAWDQFSIGRRALFVSPSFMVVRLGKASRL